MKLLLNLIRQQRVLRLSFTCKGKAAEKNAGRVSVAVSVYIKNIIFSYTCVAKNAAGESKRDFSVKLLGSFFLILSSMMEHIHDPHNIKIVLIVLFQFIYLF